MTFWDQVDKAGECWLWTGYIDRNGYGVHQYHGTFFAHRVSYQEMVGPIPEGLVLDHLCRVRNCVNPAHLEVVTVAVNTLRGESPLAKNARKDSCDSGHEFTAENTYMRPKGGRQCRECGREAWRRWKSKQVTHA